MPTKKFDNIEELNEERKELDSKFESGLPDYLIDYFDEKEKKLLQQEFFKQKRLAKITTPPKERYEYKKKEEEDFWQENETELVKVSRTVPDEFKFSFKEPERNTNDNERELTQEEISVLITLCEKDLYLFGIRYFPHYLKKPSSRLHKFLYTTISLELNKYPNGVKRVVAAPRAGAKSTIVSNITPLWCVCYNKKKFIIMLSDTLSQAEDFLYDIKQELELNEKIARDFPHVAGKGPVWRTNEIITNNGIKILALGTGNKIRGRRFGIHRPDLILGDDLENSEMVKSEVQRDYIRYEWFNKEVIFVGGEEGSSTDFFIVGTSIGKDALLNALLDPEQYPDWKGTRFAAVEQFHDPEVDHLWEKWKEIYKNRFDIDRKENSRKFFDEHKEEMLKGTRVLWPEGDPYYNLMEYKVSNPSGFETEKMNQPIDITKIYVTEEELHFEYFRGNKEIREAVNRAIERGLIFGALDPSLGKKSKKGDFSCIVTSARDPKSGYIFVLDISLRRRSVDEQIWDILNFHQKYKYKKFAVETNAFQYVVAENLRKIGRQEGIYVPVEEIVNYQDKKMRVEGIVPFLKDGTIVFDKEKRKHDSMYARGIEQITSFTGENDAEDDCPDCLEMCFRIAQAPSFKMSHLPTKKDRR